MGYNIAIDGPSGAGKSTIARRVANKLGFVYVDTGAMYRAMAVFFLQEKLDPANKALIAAACSNANITIAYEQGIQQVYLNGVNVTDSLRNEKVGSMASMCSAIPQVRIHLLELQRALARTQDVVMDGRDIGTNILPKADVKIFLTASVEKRAERRYLELKGKGMACSLDEITSEIQIRDERDMTRAIAPLRQAVEAVLIDSSELTVNEVAEIIIKECVWR